MAAGISGLVKIRSIWLAVDQSTVRPVKPQRPIRAYNGAMVIETFPVGLLQCNCTLAADTEHGEAIVIDPGDDIQRIHRRLTELGVTLRQIIITHAHIDHVGGALQLKRLTGAPILMHADDMPLLRMMEVQAGWLGVPTPETAPPDESLRESMVVGLTRYPATVLHTPGHTPGSVCLHFDTQKLLITGDTLFAGTIGRTDLPGGNPQQILASIHNKLMLLPDQTRVLAGHGAETTLEREKATNPFLQRR